MCIGSLQQRATDSINQRRAALGMSAMTTADLFRGFADRQKAKAAQSQPQKLGQA